MSEWAWTINDVLEQPEELLQAVAYLKAIGERMRRQAFDQRTSSDTDDTEAEELNG